MISGVAFQQTYRLANERANEHALRMQQFPALDFSRTEVKQASGVEVDIKDLAAQLDEWARNFEPGERRFEAADVMVRNFENREHVQSKVLGLQGMGLKTLPEEIGHFTHLVKLDLSDNPIHQLPSAISKLVNIQQVLLSSRHLQDALQPHQSISGLDRLSALSAGTNKPIWLTVHMDNPIRSPYSDFKLAQSKVVESMASARFRSDATDRTRENTAAD